MLSTSGEFVEVLNFRKDNEESSEETTGCKASVYAGFDECTRSENFIEILRFRHFARDMSFTPTGKQVFMKLICNIGQKATSRSKHAISDICSKFPFRLGKAF